jgi:hypothetical protein
MDTFLSALSSIYVKASVPEIDLRPAKDGVSFGELGIFVLVSYAAGHLIAAVGNATESFLWRLVGGTPSDWVTRTQTSLLSAPQIDLLEKKSTCALA